MHELLWPVVNFIALVIILGVVSRKTVPQLVAKRREMIKNEVDEALAQKNEAERKFREFEQKLEAFEKEASQMVDRARADGEAVKAKIIENARTAAERMVRDTESTVQTKIEETKREIRQEIISSAIKIAEKEIRNRLSAEDHRRIVHEYVGVVQANGRGNGAHKQDDSKTKRFET